MVSIIIYLIYLSDIFDLDHDLSICSIYLIWIMTRLFSLSDISDLDHDVSDLSDLSELDHDVPDISVRFISSGLSVYSILCTP